MRTPPLILIFALCFLQAGVCLANPCAVALALQKKCQFLVQGARGTCASVSTINLLRILQKRRNPRAKLVPAQKQLDALEARFMANHRTNVGVGLFYDETAQILLDETRFLEFNVGLKGYYILGEEDGSLRFPDAVEGMEHLEGGYDLRWDHFDIEEGELGILGLHAVHDEESRARGHAFLAVGGTKSKGRRVLTLLNPHVDYFTRLEVTGKPGEFQLDLIGPNPNEFWEGGYKARDFQLTTSSFIKVKSK